MNEKHYLLCLNAVEGIGGIRFRKLLEFFKTAKNIFRASHKSLENCGFLSKKIIENIQSFDCRRFLDQELDLLNRYQTQFMTLMDHDYPACLRQLPDFPGILYLKGRLKPEHGLSLALVGSRRASFYGLEMAEKFAGQLSELGLTIISGLAHGIDAAAHRGALKAGGCTIAVLGCGLKTIYPECNVKLSEDIVSHNGVLISEYPMNEPPRAHNFPRRNRIVSGLSLAVLVVEAAKRSGALITSHCALEQGKDVFAVPGKVNSPTTAGVHQLIKEGAKLTTCVEDILEELHPQIQHQLQSIHRSNDRKVTPTAMGWELSKNEVDLFSYIDKNACHIDEIISRSRFNASQVTSLLLQLELKGCIKRLPGKHFART